MIDIRERGDAGVADLGIVIVMIICVTLVMEISAYSNYQAKAHLFLQIKLSKQQNQ